MKHHLLFILFFLSFNLFAQQTPIPGNTSSGIDGDLQKLQQFPIIFAFKKRFSKIQQYC